MKWLSDQQAVTNHAGQPKASCLFGHAIVGNNLLSARTAKSRRLH